MEYISSQVLVSGFYDDRFTVVISSSQFSEKPKVEMNNLDHKFLATDVDFPTPNCFEKYIRGKKLQSYFFFFGLYDDHRSKDTWDDRRKSNISKGKRAYIFLKFFIRSWKVYLLNDNKFYTN